MDPSVDATKYGQSTATEGEGQKEDVETRPDSTEISSSEEEQTKDLEKKDNNQLTESKSVGACKDADQTTLNLPKQPKCIGHSATATATESGGAEPSQSTAAEGEGQKEDVETRPDSTVEEDGKIDSEMPDNGQSTASRVLEGVNEDDGKHTESSEEDGSKPPVQPKPCEQEQCRPEGPLYTKMAVLMAGLAVIIGLICFDYSSEQPAPRTDSKIDIFHREFEKMKSSFPSQREELWKRSKIHLEKHLQTAGPTEPVSMILTAGRRAEGTLRCLATRMAETFSSALGASVLHIDGASRAALESDQVKLDIDQQLGGAFEGDRKAAVIHRFEELPPGSTLIFYRYCDHENAAYKKVLLVFTVQLPAEELSAELALNTVEEMVQEHIEGKFLSQSSSASYDQMDRDKLSGLWSRISHLILPVTAEEPIEQQGCDHLKSLQQ